jgi:hypothetical protein
MESTEDHMKRKLLWAASFCAALLIAIGQTPASAQTGAGSHLRGTVTGPGGPEAGVWVIAETTNLPTKFAKIVVTDDQGRYLIPDLPKGNYSVWVRGYGLVDSAKVGAVPGATLDLRATVAPSAAAAAEYYPSIYWYSLLSIPDKKEFPGTGDGPKGNGIEPAMLTQYHWLNTVKTNGCVACHALGTKGTRTLPKDFTHYTNATDAWTRRIVSGQAMTNMVSVASRMGALRALTQFGDWTDRIAKGELPFDKPQRPQGVERNVVLTMWDWSRNTAYLHDIIGTDKRKPTVNANGKFYGATEFSTDWLPILDPRTHTATEVFHPVRDPKTPSHANDPLSPSPYWGEKVIWDAKTSNHNPMMDHLGRVWFTARVRPPENPAFCGKGSSHPSAKVFPMERSTRHTSMYDPKSGKFSLISTCFPTHHLSFGEDANHTLWFSSGSGGNGVLGWVNSAVYDKTGNEELAQGWTPFIIDANGNGKRDEWVEPNQATDPTKDKRVNVNLYSVAYNPVDGSIWGTAPATTPGYIVRVAPGSDPTNTALAEIYEPPMPGYGPRGGDIDRNGVFWVSLASGHLGEFDRRRCKSPLNGPASVTGKHCPEGWTLHVMPGPNFKGITESGSAEASYYTWVDQFDIFGLGKNVPIATGNLNDSIMALVDGKWVNLRVPYPVGFYTKWVEGRIDDPNAGWKGKSLWTTTSTRTMFHLEGGTANKPKVVRFQLRPDPLAN